MTSKAIIPVAHPVLGGNEKTYVMECLETGWISSIGRFISLFESKFAEFCGASCAVATNNGTSALHLALAALGVGPGDEVIVPTLTYVASANAVRYCGARPVFVDAEPGAMNLDPALIESKLTERTKGIVVVHLFGHPADVDPILEIARRRGLFVLEDAAEAHGALYRGRPVGSLGDIAAFSFYGNKILSTGEGGMVVTSKPELRDRALLLRGQGMDPARRYWFPVVGFNYRMTNIAAAIGLAQLEQVDGFLEQRKTLAATYKFFLHDIQEFVQIPIEYAWAQHSYWAFPIVLRDSVRLCRDRIICALENDGIESRPVFHPMHELPPYREESGAYPVADRFSARGICLPMHCALSQDDIAYIAARLAYWCRKSAE